MESCSIHNGLSLYSSVGFLSSLTVVESATVGTNRCPWKIEAPQGQRINITLFDFSTSSMAGQAAMTEPGSLQHSSTGCRDGWIIVVGEHNMTVEIPGCGVPSTVTRQRLVYTSHSNKVSVHLEQRSPITTPQADQHILMRYQSEPYLYVFLNYLTGFKDIIPVSYHCVRYHVRYHVAISTVQSFHVEQNAVTTSPRMIKN